MSYVGAPFLHDIFVSYSHGADHQGRPYLHAWSAAFAQALEDELRFDVKLREPLSLFLDTHHRDGQGVDPMSALTDQLREQVGAAAVLVLLMSPDYIGSQWCTQERDWWARRQIEMGLFGDPVDKRIAVVKILPTEVPWPDLLKDSAGEPLLGYTFHTDAHGAVRPIGYVDLPGPFGSDFKKALLPLVARLYTALREIRGQLDERRRAELESAKLAQEGGQTIYLHGRVDHAAAWDRAALALGDRGYAVVPGEPDPVEHDARRIQEVRERRVEALSGCDALLLVGTEDGRALDADLVVVGKHDRQSARARTNRLLPCGLLDTVGAPIATAVRRTTARIMQADWLDATQAGWPAQVAAWLQSKSAQARPE